MTHVRTLKTIIQLGPVSMNLVETVGDEQSPSLRIQDYEVQCEECERYACTRLTEDEATEETADHALTVHHLRLELR